MSTVGEASLRPLGSTGAPSRTARYHCLNMSVGAVVLGSIGMLTGARLDFGQFGLAAIADWCRVLQPLSLDSIRSQMALAPSTCLGMLAGCNLGMALSARLFGQPAETPPVLILRFVACNTGMILGMLLAEKLLADSGAAVPNLPVAVRIFGIMILGMTAGMLGGWWLAEWMRRGWTRWSATLASLYSPPLRN